MEDSTEAQGSDQGAYDAAKASKFRLKSKSRSKRHRDDKQEDGHERHSHKRRHSDDERRRHRDSKHRRKHSSRRSHYDHTYTSSSRHGGYDEDDHRHRESLYDDVDQRPSMNDDDAFRESLFDALADDEGAAYWEGVYGQPVHIYPDTKPGPDGKLEKMSEEEYADYVRTKMWEKTHQHVLEERAARERARKKAKDQGQRLEEETAQQEEERERIRRRMQESLKRGEARKKAKEADASWSQYLKKWEELKQRKDLAQEGTNARELIPWPVVSGKWKHVWKDDIDYFFENSSAWKEDPVAMLKAERVRWHPDKMQQRFGQHIDEETMRSVTAVFQVIDRLWDQQRNLR